MILTKKKDTITFGKHKGKKVYEVLDKDPQYLEWLIDKTDRTNFNDYLIYKIKRKADKARYDRFDDYIGGLPDIF